MWQPAEIIAKCHILLWWRKWFKQEYTTDVCYTCLYFFYLIQLFPADEILDTNTCLNEDLICFPIIKVSGQEKPFLTLVDVELIYSHDDVADLNETFFPIGQTFPFSDKYGVLLRNHKDSQAKHKWKKAKDDKNAEITRMQKNTLKITFSVEHFCK